MRPLWRGPGAKDGAGCHHRGAAPHRTTPGAAGSLASTRRPAPCDSMSEHTEHPTETTEAAERKEAAGQVPVPSGEAAPLAPAPGESPAAEAAPAEPAPAPPGAGAGAGPLRSHGAPDGRAPRRAARRSCPARDLRAGV